MEEYKRVQDKTNSIISNLHTLNSNIGTIKTKITILDTLNTQLDKNKVLKHDNNNLTFQSMILKNEYNYYTNIYNILINKYSNELYELAEYILYILLSLNNIEIDDTENKQVVFNKIIYIHKIKNITGGKLNELINSIIINLKTVDEFLSLFKKYIEKIQKSNNIKNIHNRTFECNIQHKNEIILLDYNKYRDKFTKMINYFKDCSDSIIVQIESSPILDFFLKLKDSV